MLNAGIHRAFSEGTRRLATHDGVRPIGQGQPVAEGALAARVLVHETDAVRWMASPGLQDEVFGPSSLLVRCDDVAQMVAAAEQLTGQLTATLQVDPDDHAPARRLLRVLERKAGRILANGFPTGVEVGYAMVHGGPWPATTDGRSTSVGACAIDRFLRPVCYQDLPEALWPAELREDALRTSWRVVDGAIVGPVPAVPEVAALRPHLPHLFSQERPE
jgi:NADP-dependent aldehyde dehydrogenase